MRDQRGNAGWNDVCKLRRHAALLKIADEVQGYRGRQVFGKSFHFGHQPAEVKTLGADTRCVQRGELCRPVGRCRLQNAHRAVGGEHLQRRAVRRVIDGVTRLFQRLVEDTAAPHGYGRVQNDQPAAGARVAGRTGVTLNKRFCKGERKQQQQQSAQGKQQQIFEFFADVHLLLGGFKQHGRAERLAIRALGLQPVQPERQRNGEYADEEQWSNQSHAYFRRCRNSR